MSRTYFITVSPSESIKVGNCTMQYVASKGRNEIVVKVQGEEQITMVRRDGTERTISKNLDKLATATVIKRLAIDSVQ